MPTTPPPAPKKSYPWNKRISYKSGKVAQAFAGKAVPEDVKAGFSYYDSDIKTNVSLESFRAVVVASLCGIAGVTKDGDRYLNYYSNLVNDTRSDLLEVRCQGIDRALHTGLYSDIKHDVPQGVGYTQVLICFIPEYDQFMSVNLTVGLQHHLKKAIATATNTPVKKINLFGLCDLTSQYWGFRFTGEFSKVDKDGAAWSGQGEMYFMPECDAFVVNETPETKWQFDILNQGHTDCTNYVQNEQDRIYGAKEATPRATAPAQEYTAPAQEYTAPAPVSNATQVPFPTGDVTSYPEDGDPLPF